MAASVFKAPQILMQEAETALAAKANQSQGIKFICV
jgi:hypothetical protein